MMQTSEDLGETWSPPRVVFAGLKRTPPSTVVSHGLCQTADGHLLVIFGAIEGLRPGVYMFSQEGRALPHPLLVTRSADGGQSWSEPRLVPHPTLPTAGVTSRPFPLADGKICIPLEYKLTPTGPNGSAMIFSRDHGQTFDPPVMVAADQSGELNLCDARYDVLPDGRILALIWTFREDTEETIEVRRSWSSDGGQTWTAPENIGFAGQVTAPVVLPDGAVVAASNYRLPPEGIRLWGSLDGGETWGESGPIQMWDSVASRMVGEPLFQSEKAAADGGGIWEALDRFTFGTPDLVLLGDGSLLMTYYATMHRITHVRACRFRVECFGSERFKPPGEHEIEGRKFDRWVNREWYRKYNAPGKKEERQREFLETQREIMDRKYVRVMAEYHSSGLWESGGAGISGDYLSLPEALQEQLIDWSSRYPYEEDLDAFDWVAFSVEGRELARKVKEFLGEEWTVIYHDAQRAEEVAEWEDVEERRTYFEYEIT